MNRPDEARIAAILERHRAEAREWLSSHPRPPAPRRRMEVEMTEDTRRGAQHRGGPMSTTKIEWTDHSINPGIYGCSPAGHGCDNCYAARMARRLSEMGQRQYDGTADGWCNWTGKVSVDFDRIAPAFATLPKRKPARVFVTSMGDLFHEDVPSEFISRCFDYMAGLTWHTFQLLTKRSARLLEWYQWASPDGHPLPPNIHIGYSASTQADLDRGVSDLLRVPAPVRFLSLEPLLEEVNLRECAAQDDWHVDALDTPDPSLAVSWIIVGAESGPHRRPCRLEWIRSVVEQCRAAGTACFVKQLEIERLRGETWAPSLSKDPAEWPEWARVQEMPSAEEDR